MTTTDFEKLMPFGTSIRYRTGCSFASKATEVSKSSDYTEQLQLEANVGGGFGPFSFKLSAGYEKFSQTQTNSRSTSFEAKAECTEWEATMLRYFKHKPQEAFKMATATLPTPFDEANGTHIILYDAFIHEYGTHYAKSVVLGAKHIVTKSFSSRSVMNLQREKIDVSASLGLDFGDGGGDDSSEDGVCCGGELSIPTAKAPAPQIEGGFKFSRETTNMDKVEGQVAEKQETNIGGTPPEDGNWRVWAASVPTRLMPISYKLEPLENFVDGDLGPSLRMAIEDHYRRAMIPDPDAEFTTGVVKDGLRFGVSRADGTPISAYTSSSYTELRTLSVLNPPLIIDETTGIVENPGAMPSFFSYDLEWESKEDTLSAVFLSFIRDNISPNIKEDLNEFAYLDDSDDKLNINNNIWPFGVLNDLSSKDAKIAVGSFKNVVPTSEGELNDFCYLAADNLEDDEGFIVGVVHPQGYPLNKKFGLSIGYSVFQYDDRHFQIDFDKEFDEVPTLLNFPLWADRKREPNNAGQILIANTGCDTKSCNITTGAVQTVATSYRPGPGGGFIDTIVQIGSSIVKSIGSFFGLRRLQQTETETKVDDRVDESLGFSFLAIDGNLTDNIGLVHGVVDLTTVSDQGEEVIVWVDNIVNGDMFYKATPKFTTSDRPVASFETNTRNDTNATTPMLNTTQVTGGVLIEFGSKFLCVPSVIVSPIIEDDVLAGKDFEHTRFSEEFGSAGYQVIRTLVTGVLGVNPIGLVADIAGVLGSHRLNFDPKEIRAIRAPMGIVEHINEKQTFIKAGLLDTFSVVDGGNPEDAIIFTPTKFSFVAVGPVSLDE